MAKQVTLNLIVDKSSNRLIYAESDEHFVDILLSFLTLPLSLILQLTNQSIGSMNNLLESVRSLKSDCFTSEACRSMLLCPSNSSSNLLSSLPIQYDNISNLFHKYYTCSTCSSSSLSLYAMAHCTRGGLLDKILSFEPDATSSNNAHFGVFFKGAFKFIISDDLLVSQSSVEFSMKQLSKLDIKQSSSLESMIVYLTAEKIIELLKRLLVSDTPLTDVFLGVPKEKDKLQVIQQFLRPKRDETEAPGAYKRKFSLRLYTNKEDTVLIAESGDDLVDLMFGFLTYPMGAVISKLEGQSGIKCFDNLYTSVKALQPANCFRYELIEKFVNPQLPPFFKINNLINLAEENQTQNYFNCNTSVCFAKYKVGNNPNACQNCKREKRRLYLTDPKRCSNVEQSKGGYMRISRYMITDDLVIRQPSSFMVITNILKGAVGKEIQARNVEIGEHEALSLLRSSITSKNVLTDALLGVERGKRHCRSY